MAEENNNENQENEPKTFTQEEVNALVGKASEKEQAKFLKSLGVESLDNLKNGLAELAELKKKAAEKPKAPEASKSDDEDKEYKQKLEKLQKDLEDIKSENSKIKEANTAKEIKELATKLGASEKYAGQIAKLLPEGEKVTEEVVKTFLNDNPIYLAKSEVQDFGGKGGGKTEKTAEQVQKRLEKAMGIK